MTELTQEVPRPGAVFWETVKHPENITILEGDAKTRKLPPDKLKQAIIRRDQLQSAINVYLVAFIDHLNERRSGETNPEKIKAIDYRIEQAALRVHKVQKQRRNPVSIKTSEQAKEALTIIHRLNARIDEHRRAMENDKINRVLQNEMQSEIAFYANQIIERWSALGYREEVWIKNKKKLRKVRFEEAHFTEDNIQFKVYVSHLTLLGSTVHHLPQNVRGWDLIKEETLLELEAACECPVTSPHTEDNQGFERGVWVVVHRVGMRDGLFNYVELNKLLPKYNQGLRSKFAVPVGIKSGRLIEYLCLSDVPHLMFNGITGSGKTNVARAFIATWIRFFSPDEIKFVLVDLKRSGDINYFATIPHNIVPILKSVEELERILVQLVALMQQRMKQLSDTNCVDIIQFNSKHHDKMARVVVLIDECGSIGDLSDTVAQKTTIFKCLALLSAQARAAGIHLMLGTQQPSRESIPTKITNNITYTLSGRQRTTSGAMIALGNNKLKDLPAIKGRMLVDNGFNLVQVQTPFATENDILESVQIASDYPEPKPFHLPGAAHIEDMAEDDPTIPAMGVTRDRVIELALEMDGVLSAQKIYEQTKGITPRANIQELIKQLANERSIQWQGEEYEIKPYRKGHQITKTQKTAGANTGVLEGVVDGFIEVEV